MYKWYQSSGTVVISFQVPANTTSGDIVSELGTNNSIKIGLKGFTPHLQGTLLLAGKACSAMIKEDRALIHIEKTLKKRWNKLLNKSTAVLRARVLYDYEGNGDEGELAPLYTHEIIAITEKDESGWWEGRRKNQVGIFPSNFVQEFDVDYQGTEDINMSYEFSMMEDGKIEKIPCFGNINLKLGGGERSPVMRTYSQQLSVDSSKSSSSPSTSPIGSPLQERAAKDDSKLTNLWKRPLKKLSNVIARESNGAGDGVSSTSPPKETVKTVICRARVKFEYKTDLPGELSLRVGEVVSVVAKDNSGWWQGVNSAGQQGWFSQTFVEEVKDPVLPPTKSSTSPLPSSPIQRPSNKSVTPASVETKLKAIKETPKLEHVRRPAAARGRRPPTRMRATCILTPEEREERDRLKSEYNEIVSSMTKNEDVVSGGNGGSENEDDPEIQQIMSIIDVPSITVNSNNGSGHSNGHGHDRLSRYSTLPTRRSVMYDNLEMDIVPGPTQQDPTQSPSPTPSPAPSPTKPAPPPVAKRPALKPRASVACIEHSATMASSAPAPFAPPTSQSPLQHRRDIDKEPIKQVSKQDPPGGQAISKPIVTPPQSSVETLFKELPAITNHLASIHLPKATFEHLAHPLIDDFMSIAACSVQGRRWNSGDLSTAKSKDEVKVPAFQVIWPVLYSMLCDELGVDEVRRAIDSHPNPMVRNPFTLAGALVQTYLYSQRCPNASQRLARVLSKLQQVIGCEDPVTCDLVSYLSQRSMVASNHGQGELGNTASILQNAVLHKLQH
ncbi:hypothetical protein SAMD00019534_096790 [Acytostelium subglobosum LB1]|uniref:hypothetical protein n=1 Tax=Acytostelium subglobosum LB1 TaxID=1410327 RepID=UPI000644DF36|nr:hypothetical protein SAMD00019534_096790 [Acytostelium subglobosum LB1]GAM26504.1 hypothetical protein SAMD00019534_096790 [Acytostelium subglobosum LB1]|eukprot:XP_012750600.1 hypothetical protein SAMD00019534_096790 [Acytostelium subglobosum LB1]